MADIPAYVVVDHILKSENEQITEQNTFNVSFTNLVEGDRNAIADWIKEDLQYDELKNAPALPPDTNNESPAYEIVSGERKIKGFDEVAFTGSYSDLSGAPGIPAAGYDNGQVKDFNPVAFTGITNLGNVQVSEVLDLRNYSGGVDALGQDSVYIDGMPQGLGTAVAAFCTGFDTNKGKKPYYIITNAVTGGKVYQVLNVSIQKDGPDTLYYKIDVANVNTSSYPYVNGSKGDSVLENIEITSKLGCFIFDLVNNCIYYKSENVNADIELPELADVATSGSYNDLEDRPNLDASDNNTDISGLATVATTGSFNDLEDIEGIKQNFEINFADFKVTIDGTPLTQDDNINLNSVGVGSFIINNISNLKNNNNISLLNKIDALINAYENNQEIHLISNDFYYILDNLNIIKNGNEWTYLYLYFNTHLLANNYSSLLQEQNADIITDLDIQLQVPFIIIDKNLNKLYSKVFYYFMSNIIS